MDILGIHIGDNRYEAYNRLSLSRSVKTGKDCFYIDENIFGSFKFSITYYYVGEYIERIALTYTQSNKGVEGHITSIEEVVGKVCEYFNSCLGLPISENKTEKGGNAIWSDINITVGYFYQMQNGISKYLDHSRDTNCVIIQITDFASRIKDAEFKEFFLKVRRNKKLAITDRKQIGTCIKMKIPSLYTKYILLAILVLTCMFIYAFSHRYQVVYNGRGIIDKWTGTVEEVKYEK